MQAARVKAAPPPTVACPEAWLRCPAISQRERRLASLATLNNYTEQCVCRNLPATATATHGFPFMNI
ncbi:hypothetical protein E2C01_062352 [Portunus trituberculatus]|uniref:Uncharacterized protein n=1 Tax=Portunus trituberculatus TaxID=210409 RepID=A0A5B7HEW4_PORTR|nr:hypothetical protein [Portunus trituberculatus]